MDFWRKLVAVSIVFYAVLFGWIFWQNLTADTDYPYHLHRIWALTQGYYITDPYLSHGTEFTLKYGAIPLLLGVLIYPVFRVYTVAVLLVIAFCLLWYFSQQLFSKLATARIARLATIIVLLNPLTVMLFVTTKMPFLWGVVFGVLSLNYYLEGKRVVAAVLGAISIITHPLCIGLLAAILMLRFDLKNWLKYYLPVCVLSGVQAVFFLGGSEGGGQIYLPPTLLLVSSLITLFATRQSSRVPCAIALAALAISLAAGYAPTAYFERMAWFVIFISIPFYVELVGSRLRQVVCPVSAFAMVISVFMVCLNPTLARADNPEVYENLLAENEILEILTDGYVRYSGDGSALYVLPFGGVRFSNSGVELHEFSSYENAAEYYDLLLSENASFVMVYQQSPEENYLVELGFPLAFSYENLRVYQVIS